MTKTEKAWVAGFIDGEGCFVASLRLHERSRHLPVAHIHVVNTHLPSILDLQRMTKRGRVYNKPRGSNVPKTRRPMFIWFVFRRDDVISLLTELLPYLHVKRDEAVALLKFTQIHADIKDRRAKERRKGFTSAERLELKQAASKVSALKRRRYRLRGRRHYEEITAESAQSRSCTASRKKGT